MRRMRWRGGREVRARLFRSAGFGGALFIVTLAFAAPAMAVPNDGGLTQLPGTQGCIRGQTGAANSKCALSTATGLLDASSAVVSPDGLFVYVTSTYEPGAKATGGAITIFSRNPTTGALTQLPGPAGCIRSPNSNPIQSSSP